MKACPERVNNKDSKKVNFRQNYYCTIFRLKYTGIH